MKLKIRTFDRNSWKFGNFVGKKFNIQKTTILVIFHMEEGRRCIVCEYLYISALITFDRTAAQNAIPYVRHIIAIAQELLINLQKNKTIKVSYKWKQFSRKQCLKIGQQSHSSVSFPYLNRQCPHVFSSIFASLRWPQTRGPETFL